MKKLMILGGDNKSIPVIVAAKKRGYYTILCDYNNNLESIKMVDKFYCVSVFDKKKLYEIAKEEEVKGIVSYSSDKIALIACEIANLVGVTKNPVNSIETLIRKDKFRQFLKDNDFNVPHCEYFNELNIDVINKIKKMSFPLMVKPVDSAGSTGVTKIETLEQIQQAYNVAKTNSQSGQVIVEEFIEMNHECMIAGDAFVYNGTIEFFGLLNSHRGLQYHPFIPTGTSYPFFIKDKEQQIKDTVQKVIKELKIDNGPLNLELMYGKNNKLYIIEIAPRNGGNLIPDIIQDTYGVDLFDALVSSAVGDRPNLQSNVKYKYATTYVLRSEKKGQFKSVIYDDELKKHIYKEVLYKKENDEILSFDRANRAVGILFLNFNNLEDEIKMIHNMEKHIQINLK